MEFWKDSKFPWILLLIGAGLIASHYIFGMEGKIVIVSGWCTIIAVMMAWWFDTATTTDKKWLKAVLVGVPMALIFIFMITSMIWEDEYRKALGIKVKPRVTNNQTQTTGM